MITSFFGGEFFGGEFFNSSTAAVVDTHDGGREPHRRRQIEVEPFDREFDKPRERLREQIRLALEGPRAVEVRKALEPVATDAVEPLHARIDVGALRSEVIAIVEAGYAAWLAEQDDEDFLLLI